MPQRIVCKGCGFTLYEGAEVKQPVEVILQYDSKCPKCNKALEYDVNKIRLNLLNPTREFNTRSRSQVSR